MGLVIRLVFSAIVGFVSHVFWQPSREFEHAYGARLGNKLRDAVGILTFLPSMILVSDGLEMRRGRTSMLISGLLTALSYGGGNFLAHLMDNKDK